LQKDITAREIFLKHPEIEKFLQDGHFPANSYHFNIVGSSGDEQVIKVQDWLVERLFSKHF